jgi:hypothetical protein
MRQVLKQPIEYIMDSYHKDFAIIISEIDWIESDVALRVLLQQDTESFQRVEAGAIV